MRATALVVEDDRVAAQLMEYVVRARLGLDVVVETEGEKAAARIAAERFALVILDIELPGIDGLDLLARVKQVDPATPVIVTTGHERFDYALAAIEGRADDFIVKPIRPEMLQRKAGQLLESARSRQAARTSVLAISAHPDDVEIGCGGILLRHRRAGHDVTILTLTNGERGGDVRTRVNESEAAAELVGARLILRDLPDTRLSEGGGTIDAIAEAIEATNPTVIYTHTLNDNHQDHRAAHRATVVAARRVPEIHCYQSPSTAVSFAPTRFVDISDLIEQKLLAIHAFVSQHSTRHYLEDEMIRSTARYWARFGGGRYVEPLETVRAHEGFGDQGIDEAVPTLHLPIPSTAIQPALAGVA